MQKSHILNIVLAIAVVVLVIQLSNKTDKSDKTGKQKSVQTDPSSDTVVAKPDTVVHAFEKK